MTTSNQDLYAFPQLAVNFIKQTIPNVLHQPHVAIVCGSGLGGIQDTIEPSPRAEIQFADVPHFPVPTGKLKEITVLVGCHI